LIQCSESPSLIWSIRTLGFDDPWKAFSPIIPATRDQTDTLAVALGTETVPVTFDFVKPLGA